MPRLPGRFFQLLYLHAAAMRCGRALQQKRPPIVRRRLILRNKVVRVWFDVHASVLFC